MIQRFIAATLTITILSALAAFVLYVAARLIEDMLFYRMI